MRFFYMLIISIFSGIANAEMFYSNEYELILKYEKGHAIDSKDGHLPWYFYYCNDKSIFSCIEIYAHFIIAVPKENVKVGDYWYFSGMKFLYAGNTTNNEMLIVSQSSENVLKAHAEACSSCLDIITIKNKSIVTSIISIYPRELQKETTTWKYSEGDFDLNKIPKEFPSEQVYSVGEVERRSKADWTPN